MLVLIVDDSKSSLLHLSRLLGEFPGVETDAFVDPQAALLSASEQRRYDLVIVDHIMPGMDGITFIRRMREMGGDHARMPIVMFTATLEDAVRLQALEAGATDFMSKSPDPFELKVRVRNLIVLADAMRRLDDQVAWLACEVEKATSNLLTREEEMIFRLSEAVGFRDNDTGDHTLRVANYSRMIAEELGLDAGKCRGIFLASPLHDLGKVAIPDNILLKPGPLDASEMSVVRTHAEIGQRLLEDSSCDLMRLAAQIAGGHHERWDGHGYPKGVSGEDIPLPARIVAVADVFDAMTTERPYKRALSSASAIEYLEKERGGHFDPACVDAFLSAYMRDPTSTRLQELAQA